MERIDNVYINEYAGGDLVACGGKMPLSSCLMATTLVAITLVLLMRTGPTKRKT